jgi:hypothetical protein
MVITSNSKEKTSRDANNIVPGGDDHSTLSHIIISRFQDDLKSANFYMPEDSPFCQAFENLRFAPPVSEFEFIARNDWAILAKMSGFAGSRLTIFFEEFDIVLSIILEDKAEEKHDSPEGMQRFEAYLRTYLFRIIKANMAYLAGLNRISQVMLTGMEIETIFPVLVKELSRLFKFGMISLVTYHPEFDSFRVEAEYEAEDDDCNFKKQFVKLSETSLAKLLAERRGLIATSKDLGQGMLAQRMIRAGFHSFLFAPVFANGELTACLILASHGMDDYDDDGLVRLNPICESIGGALMACLNYSRLKQFNDDYTEAQKNFLHLEKYRNFIDITRGILHAFNNHLALIMGRAQILSQFSGESISREAAEKGLNIILNASTWYGHNSYSR